MGDEGKVTIDTLGMDWPWVVGNVVAILGGGIIAFTGSMIDPDTTFRWGMLNDRIPLIDDVEPPKDGQETDEKLQMHVKFAWVAAWVLTIILLVLWPLPMHYSTGVFGEGNFTAWVVVEMLWAIIGAVVIIFLPAWELIRSLTGKEKVVAKTGGAKVVLQIKLSKSDKPEVTNKPEVTI